jgi:outer membrane protein assembly factor BamB
MRRLPHFVLTFVLMVGFLIIPASVEAAGDWPSFHRDPLNTGFNANETALEPPLNLLWDLGINPGGHPGLVSANGILYAQSHPDGILYAIDNSSGTILWSVQTSMSGGIAVSNDVVYAGNDCDNCTLDAFDAATGQHLWSSVSLSKGALGITVAGNVVYFGSSAHNLRAADALTGNILWETPLVSGGASNSSSF